MWILVWKSDLMSSRTYYISNRYLPNNGPQSPDNYWTTDIYEAKHFNKTELELFVNRQGWKKYIGKALNAVPSELPIKQRVVH
jgi:hypothetical protein